MTKNDEIKVTVKTENPDQKDQATLDAETDESTDKDTATQTPEEKIQGIVRGCG
jgi:hypothetical protein